MASFEDLFNAEFKRKYEVKSEPTDYEKAVAQARLSFVGPEKEITAKLTKLKAKLRSTRNVKVASASRINTERAEKRKKIRAQMEELQTALADLKMESTGSKLPLA